MAKIRVLNYWIGVKNVLGQRSFELHIEGKMPHAHKFQHLEWFTNYVFMSGRKYFRLYSPTNRRGPSVAVRPDDMRKLIKTAEIRPTWEWGETNITPVTAALARGYFLYMLNEPHDGGSGKEEDETSLVPEWVDIEFVKA